MPISAPEPEPLARLLWRAHNWFRTAIVAAMAAEGEPAAISPAQATLLSQLPPEGASIAELARRLGVSAPTAHQWVHQLAAKDILAVEASSGSGRDKLVRLTATGRQRRTETLHMLAELEIALGERIGTDAVTALRTALQAPWGSPEDTRTGARG